PPCSTLVPYTTLFRSLLPDPGHLLQNAVFKVLDTQNFTRIDDTDSTNLMPMLPDPGESPLIDAALSGITSGVVEDNEGQRWIYATRHLERVGWLFLRAVSYEQATAPARASFSQFIMISLLLLAIMLALVMLLSRAASRPLEQIAAGIRRTTENMDH